MNATLILAMARLAVVTAPQVLDLLDRWSRSGLISEAEAVAAMELYGHELDDARSRYDAAITAARARQAGA